MKQDVEKVGTAEAIMEVAKALQEIAEAIERLGFNGAIARDAPGPLERIAMTLSEGLKVGVETE